MAGKIGYQHLRGGVAITNPSTALLKLVSTGVARRVFSKWRSLTMVGWVWEREWWWWWITRLTPGMQWYGHSLMRLTRVICSLCFTLSLLVLILLLLILLILLALFAKLVNLRYTYIYTFFAISSLGFYRSRNRELPQSIDGSWATPSALAVIFLYICYGSHVSWLCIFS